MLAEVLLWVVVIALIIGLRIYFGAKPRCPKCGLELTETQLDEVEGYRFSKLDSCDSCGWKRRD